LLPASIDRKVVSCGYSVRRAHLRNRALLIESIRNLFLHCPDVQDGQVRIYLSEGTA
jgi:hypothetical protein